MARAAESSAVTPVALAARNEGSAKPPPAGNFLTSREFSAAAEAV
jgi:hypothetical protein